MATGTDLCARYGAIRSIGKVCMALQSLDIPINEETLTAIAEIEPKVWLALQFIVASDHKVKRFFFKISGFIDDVLVQ